MKLTPTLIDEAIIEIQGESEVTRRTLQKKRHDIYNDGGKAFLLEQLRREFSEDAVKEMRLCPINLLKKIVNKRSRCYARPPVRTCSNPADQALVEYYEKKLKVNQLFQKANRKFNLHSNTVIYSRPVPSKKNPLVSELSSTVVPPYLYSLIPDGYDQACAGAYVFNAFVESGRLPTGLPSATGNESYSSEAGFKFPGDKVASNERDSELDSRQFLFWTDSGHVTVNGKGEVISFDTSKPLELQMQNPIGRMPVTNIAKDRDNEPWAVQGEDLVDLTMVVQLSFSDVFTIAKHQGYGIMTIVSEDEPKKLLVGVNKSIWLRTKKDGVEPKISYAQSSAPLSEYKELILELLALLLSTNDMEPGAISGKAAAANITSGFHALLAMSDNLEAIEADKPVFADAERDYWEVISLWHNYLFSLGSLEEDARELGTFSSDFEVSVQYQDVKPLESEDEKLARIEKKTQLRLISRKNSMKELKPDMTEDQVDQALQEIDDEVVTSIETQEPAVATESEVEPSAPITPVVDVQKQAFNGSQVASMVEIVLSVANGRIPRDSGVKIISTSFQISEEEASGILASAGTGFVPKVEPVAQRGGPVSSQ